MIIRDTLNRFVTTNLDSKRMLEKIVENDKKVNVIFESGIDQTCSAAFTIEGDVERFWGNVIGSGVSCISRI